MYSSVFHTYLTRKIRNDFDIKLYKLVKSTSSAVIITSVQLLHRLENKKQYTHSDDVAIEIKIIFSLKM